MENIWIFIEQRLEQGNPVILLVVTEVKGSSPGKRGFKMAVDSTGEKTGSIGGGPMEFTMEKLSVEQLQDPSPGAFTKRMVHSADAGEEASGLICAGEQRHVLVTISPDESSTVRSIRQSLESGKGGHLYVTAGGLHFSGNDSSEPSAAGRPEGDVIYEEVLTPSPVLYIFGGGHVSIPVSQLGRMLGFRVEVYDNREGLSTLEENTWANAKGVIQYENAATLIRSPESSFVCIMTVAHASDERVLEQMLPLPLRYLGMIGSRNKVRTLFSNLREKGADLSALERVDAPMGVPINSETPAEIAVSIFAEIIRRKNKR